MTTFHDFSLKAIDGKELSLRDFAGKVVLAVNVASECGYTPQYEGLEALYKELAPKGLVVVGFPSNDYGAQEPGADAEIQNFCKVRYGVTFPLASKITTKGEAKHPLYAWLTSQAEPAGEVRWNFEKFLLNKDGSIAGRFKSGVEPKSGELRAAIEAALAR